MSAKRSSSLNARRRLRRQDFPDRGQIANDDKAFLELADHLVPVAQPHIRTLAVREIDHSPTRARETAERVCVLCVWLSGTILAIGGHNNP